MSSIVVFNQSSGYLTTDIANAFANRYEKVALVVGNDKVYERKLDPCIEYRRITSYKRNSSVTRLITWVLGFAQIVWLLITRYRKYEVMFVSNPPMSCFASCFTKQPYDVLIFDVYPDALANIGIKQGSFICRFWSNKNKKVYAEARNIFTISETMAKAVSKYAPFEKIKMIPIWPSSENFKPIVKNANDWALSQGIQDKFVVLYSGNMGLTHNVDVLIEVANKMKDNVRVLFLLIGQGGKKEQMIKRAKELSLTNCTFLDFQPTEMLPYSLASADLGVITLNNVSASVSIPSKTFNLMAVGAPLLCIAPNESEISRMVAKYHNGRVFGADDIDEMADYIELLSMDDSYKRQLSNNSLNAAKDFSYHNAERYVS